MLLSKLVSKDVKKSAEQFVDRIQRGIYKKDTSPNTSAGYQENEALESGKEFVRSKSFQKLFFKH
jgi:hypothetical protein